MNLLGGWIPADNAWATQISLFCCSKLAGTAISSAVLRVFIFALIPRVLYREIEKANSLFSAASRASCLLLISLLVISGGKARSPQDAVHRPALQSGGQACPHGRSGQVSGLRERKRLGGLGVPARRDRPTLAPKSSASRGERVGDQLTRRGGLNVRPICVSPE